MNKKERAIILLLAAINFTQVLDFVNMVPLSIYLIPDLRISAFQFSTLVASYSISAFFSGIIAALLIDRHDRKKSLLIAFTGFLIGSFACGIAPNYVTLLIARIVSGTFGGLLGAQLYSIVADTFSYERRGRAMGIVMSAFAIASVIGIPLSLLLTNVFNSNWHLPFLANGFFGLLLLPLMIKYLPANEGAYHNFWFIYYFWKPYKPNEDPHTAICTYIFMFVHVWPFFSDPIYSILS